jgi:hypothetical protein
MRTSASRVVRAACTGRAHDVRRGMRRTSRAAPDQGCLAHARVWKSRMFGGVRGRAIGRALGRVGGRVIFRDLGRRCRVMTRAATSPPGAAHRATGARRGSRETLWQRAGFSLYSAAVETPP